MKRLFQTILAIVLMGLCVGGISTVTMAKGLGVIHRLSAEWQFDSSLGAPEVMTVLNPAPGGTGGKLVYSKTLFVPFHTLYVTFSATGDAHDGAALLMTCLVDGVVCQPGGGQSHAGPSGWVTLLKLPVAPGVSNCSDGGGGTGDCHDNSIHYTWCAQVEPGVHTIDLRLASSTGTQVLPVSGRVFYERAHIYIDATHHQEKKDVACTPATFVPFSGLP